MKTLRMAAVMLMLLAFALPSSAASVGPVPIQLQITKLFYRGSQPKAPDVRLTIQMGQNPTVERVIEPRQELIIQGACFNTGVTTLCDPFNVQSVVDPVSATFSRTANLDIEIGLHAPTLIMQVPLTVDLFTGAFTLHNIAEPLFKGDPGETCQSQFLDNGDRWGICWKLAGICQQATCPNGADTACAGDPCTPNPPLACNNASSTVSCDSGIAACPLPSNPGPCSVSICTVWNANYVDTGFGEDVAAAAQVQRIPASFATFTLLRDGQQVLTGNLDKGGCTDVSSLALTTDLTLSHPGSQWTLQTKSVMVKPMGAQAITMNVQERMATVAPTMSPPETQNPTAPLTVSSTFSIVSGGTTQVEPTTRNNVTAVSAFASALLSRDDDLGLKAGTSMTAFAGQGCPDGGDNSCAPKTETNASCASPSCPVLYIAPNFTAQGTCPSTISNGDSHWKYVIAHEFGHVIQQTFGVSIGATYIPTIANRPAICRCDHVLVANQKHCLQSLDRANDAQLEGFGQFYAASVWNSPASTSCAFAYYKEFLVQDRPNLPDTAFNFITEPLENRTPDLNSLCSKGKALPPGGGANSFYSILPPMFVDCLGVPGATDPRQFVNYRTQAGCWPATSIADYSTEFDWLKFYINVARNPDVVNGVAVAVPATPLLNLYASLCNAASPCGGSQQMPQLSTPGWVDLLARAKLSLKPAQATAFEIAGSTFGVNRN